MQYFNSKSNKKSDEVNILGDDKNILGSIDMFNFDKVKNETSFTEKKPTQKQSQTKNNIVEDENLYNQEISESEEESNQWTKNMVTEKLNQLESGKANPDEFSNKNSFSGLERDRTNSLLDNSQGLSDQMYTSYRLNDSANSISISEEELNNDNDFVDSMPSKNQGFSFADDGSKPGKFFEELDNDAITLGIYDSHDYYDFDMSSIDESELYREGLSDDSMSVGGEDLYYEKTQNQSTEEEFILGEVNEKFDSINENNIYKDEPLTITKSIKEEEFIKSNELSFEDTSEETSDNLLNDEELKRFSIEIEKSYEQEFQLEDEEEEFQEDLENQDEETELEDQNEEDFENAYDENLVINELSVEDNSLDEELNFIEIYCSDHGFPVKDHEKDLIKFLAKSDSGEISKIKISVDGNEIFYISSIIAKILFTESILLLEKDKTTALNLLEGICLYCVDLEVSKLGLLKLKEILEIDDDMERLKTLVRSMCEKEQELLKVIYRF